MELFACNIHVDLQWKTPKAKQMCHILVTVMSQFKVNLVKYLLFGVRKGPVLLTHQRQNVHMQIGHLLIHCSKNGCKLFAQKRKNALGLFNIVFIFVLFFRFTAKMPILGCNTCKKKKPAIPLRDRVLSSKKTQMTACFWCLLRLFA